MFVLGHAGDRIRLTPLSMASPARITRREEPSVHPRHAEPTEPSPATEPIAGQLIDLCDAVLSGRRPLAALRAHSSSAGFAQLAVLHRRVTARAGDRPVRIRLVRGSAGAHGRLDVVAMLQTARWQRVVSLTVDVTSEGRRITECRMV